MNPADAGPNPPDATEAWDAEAAFACVATAGLVRYLDDRMGESESAAVEAHIDACDSCRERLEGLAARESGTDHPLPDYLDRLKQMPPQAFGAARGDPSPAERPPVPPPPAKAPLLPTIPGFRVLREVGRGGMGVVYEAVELALNRRVALKILAPKAVTTGSEVGRFRREARAAARLHHTNIIPVFGVGETPEYLYYAMQFIEGEGLDCAFRRYRLMAEKPAGAVTIATAPTADASLDDSAAPVPGRSDAPPSTASDAGRSRFRRAARIALQVALALDYAHRQGILHRDVKPANILIDGAGDAWVADFGLAKAFEGEGEADGLTRTGDIVGTLRYMSPERFEGRSDVRGDIYALGATLYELLTLRPAFAGPSRARLVERILREEPPRPRSIDRRVPRDLETIALKAMAKEPSARYASAAAMAEDLRRHLEGEPIRARRSGPAERLWRWSRRDPTVAGLSAAFAAAVVVGFALTFWKWREAASQAVDAFQARREARGLAADLTLARGLAYLLRGEATAGRLWLARSLETAEMRPESRRLARLNLDAWADASPRLRQVVAHPEAVAWMAFKPDPSALTVHCRSGKFACYDASSGEPRGEPSRALPREASRLSPDGSACAGIEPDGAIGVRDVATDRLLGPPIPRGGRQAFAPSSGGRELLIIGPEGGRFWDVATGRPTRTAPRLPSRTRFVLFDALGQIVTMAPGEADPNNPTAGWVLGFWDASGAPTAAIGDLPGANPWNEGFFLSPDGRTLAVIHQNGQVGTFDLAAHRRRGDVLKYGYITAVAFSPDGATLATGSTDGRIMLHDPLGGRRRTAVAFSPDGATLATGSAEGLLSPHDPPGVRRRGEGLIEPGRIDALAFGADGRDLAVLMDGVVRIWRMPDRPQPTRDAAAAEGTRPARIAGFAPASDQALILDPSLSFVQVVDADGRPRGAPHPVRWSTGLELAASPVAPAWAVASHEQTGVGSDLFLIGARNPPLRGHVPHNNWVLSMAFSHDGRTVAATGFGGAVWLYEPADPPKLRKRIVLNARGMSLAFSPDDKTLAVGTLNDRGTPQVPEIRLYDAATGRALRTLVHAAPWASWMQFAPDGRSLLVRTSKSYSGSPYGYYQLWDVDPLRPRGTSQGAPVPAAGAVAFLSGDRLLTKGPGGIWEWDVRAGQARRLVIPEAREPIDLVVDPASRWVAILYPDGEGQLYDAATFGPVGPPLRAERPLLSLAFARDGVTLLAAGEGWIVRSWPLPDPERHTGPGTHETAESLALATGATLDPTTGSVVPMSTESWRGRFRAPRPPDIEAADDAAARHARFADAAEAEGNLFALLWHLDRLKPLRPGDWTIEARRAMAFERDDRPAEAAAVLDRVASIAPPRELIDWEATRAAEARGARRWGGARWYLDRIIAASPDDPLALADRAEVSLADGHEGLADDDVERAAALGMDFKSLTRHADRLAAAGSWDRLATLLRTATQRGGGEPPPVLISRWAIASLMAGRQADYREACTRMMEAGRRFGADTLANNAAYMCAFGADGLDDYTQPLAMADRVLRSLPANNGRSRHMVLNTIGALDYRAGKFEAASAAFRAGIEADPAGATAQDCAFLAMTARARGDEASARRWLDRLTAASQSPDPWDHAQVSILLREIEAQARQATNPLPHELFAPPR